jgi:predicted Holliday junction resolvase-like endonuclease
VRTEPLVWLAFGVGLGVVVAGAVFWAVFSVRLQLHARRARRDAVGHARATLHGQVSEQLAPLLPGFDYDASDARFLGAPIDYVVFDGYTAGDDVEVVLVEVKTGRAKLSKGERRVRDAVRRGHVRFETVRLE